MKAIRKLATIVLLASAFPDLSLAIERSDAFDVGTLHVERFGAQGTPVILIPGLASGRWVWDNLIRELSPTHRVYAVTLAGFDGRPTVTGDVITLASESLSNLIAAQKLDRPILIGHSLGGTLALLYAANHPDQLDRVVAVDGLPVYPGTEHLDAAQRLAMAEQLRKQLSGKSLEEFQAQQLDYMRHIGVVSDAQATALAKLTSRSDREAVANYAALDMALNLTGAIARIRVPVLEISPYLASDFAAMSLTEEAKTGYYRTLLAGIKNLSVVSISPARHFVMIDQPEAFAKAVKRFLQSPAQN